MVFGDCNQDSAIDVYTLQYNLAVVRRDHTNDNVKSILSSTLA